jgi:hypothetical protein
MNLKDLIGRGYFPKELPPPFTTMDFANKFSSMKGSLQGAIDRKNTSRCINYSIAKVGLVRKLIQIPNPMHQADLSEVICDNWSIIQAEYDKSKISCSKPKLKGDRAANPSKFKEFRRKCFLASYPFAYELKTDISKYYSSIYTHSIPWVIHGKAFAKEKANRKNKSLLGNKLDSTVQRTTYGQTNGIPIGPDTSLIIAELIGVKIDELLVSSFPNIKGYRYVDDMYLFFRSLEEAEDCLLKLQGFLKEYELRINAEKTKIQKLPNGIEPDWIIQLRSFQIRETPITQYNDIISYFSLAFDLAQKNPNEYVMSYVVERIKYLKLLKDENFTLLETMILKTLTAEPSTIKEVFRVLFSYKDKVHKNRLTKVILDFIRFSCPRGYDYELSWGLWTAKTFEISIPDDIVEMLSKSKDSISTMITLDLIESGLIDKSKYDNSYWIAELNEGSLMNESWLMAYEMTVKKWIGSDFSYLTKIPYFKILNKNKVEFYNPSFQIKSINITPIGGDDVKDPKEPEITYDNSSNSSELENYSKNDKQKESKPKAIKDIFDIDFGGY